MSFFLSLLNAMPGAITQGMLWGIMAIGVYITYRILDVADLTVDGSLATGGAVCVMLMRAGWNPWAALLCAFLAGVLAGLCQQKSHPPSHHHRRACQFPFHHSGRRHPVRLPCVHRGGGQFCRLF